ncbi:hypothetical protein Tco_0152967 [Tanacetum coccineum]
MGKVCPDKINVLAGKSRPMLYLPGILSSCGLVRDIANKVLSWGNLISKLELNAEWKFGVFLFDCYLHAVRSLTLEPLIIITSTYSELLRIAVQFVSLDIQLTSLSPRNCILQIAFPSIKASGMISVETALVKSQNPLDNQSPMLMVTH